MIAIRTYIFVKILLFVCVIEISMEGSVSKKNKTTTVTKEAKSFIVGNSKVDGIYSGATNDSNTKIRLNKTLNEFSGPKMDANLSTHDRLRGKNFSEAEIRAESNIGTSALSKASHIFSPFFSKTGQAQVTASSNWRNENDAIRKEKWEINQTQQTANSEETMSLPLKSFDNNKLSPIETGESSARECNQSTAKPHKDWSSYLETEAKIFYSRFNLNSYEIKMEFLRLNYHQILRMVLTSEKIEARTIFLHEAMVSEACYDHLMDWFDQLTAVRPTTTENTENWALRMFDSFGRPSAGQINGALQLEGDYDQCLATKAYVSKNVCLNGVNVQPETKEFGARYCRVEIPVGPDYKLALPKEANSFWTEKQSFYLNFNWGICVPDTCFSEDIKTFLNTGAFKSLQLRISNVTCFNEPSLKEDSGAIMTIVLLVLFLAMVTGSSFVDIYRLHQPWLAWRNKGGNAANLATKKITREANQFCNESFELEIPSPDLVDHLGNNDYTCQNSNHKEEEMKTPTPKTVTAHEISLKPRTIGKDLINRLSFYSNFLRLIDTDNSKETFTCIQGMKVISMAWIVAGHCYTYGGLLDESNIIFKNTIELVNRASSLTFHLVGSAHLAVDTFFVISGFLVMTITLRTMKTKSKPLFWVTFYLHRFWRLTPMYMMVLAVGTNLYDHIVKGPLKANNFEEFEECKDKWWSHLLYISNFYRPDKKCMTWSWYMSVDMQLYVISPVFIYATYRSRKLGVALLTCLCVVGMVSAFVAEMVNGGQFVLMDLRFLEYWSYVYTMPYTRVAAYGIGMLLALILNDNQWKIACYPPVTFLLWILSLSMGVFLVLINHIQWKMSSELWSPWQQSLYEALVRPTWALCIAWVIYACSTGHGGMANAILSWKPFLVLSRLTYAVYLLHPLVIMFVIYSRRTAIFLHPAYMSMVYNYIGNLSLAYLLAVIFSLTFEVPMLALERLVLKRH